MTGHCPRCKSTDYGQNIVTLEGNRCNRCGYTGPVVNFHNDEPRPISAGRVADIIRSDLDRPAPRAPAKRVARSPSVSEPANDAHFWWQDE
jgi:hypothetical protein